MDTPLSAAAETRPAAAPRAAPPWLLVTIFWVFVTLLYVAQLWWLKTRPGGERLNVRATAAWQGTYYLAWIPFTLIVWRVTRGWLVEALGWRRFLVRHLTLGATVAVLHTLVLVALARPLSGENSEPFMMMVTGTLRGRLHLQMLVYSAVVGTGMSLTLYERYRERQLAASQLEAQLAAARLDALRAHLQPHFLFNSLHSIASLARAGDNAGVVRLIAGFSELLRHLLETGDRHLSLRQELLLVDRYLDIQRVRFADRLSVTIELAPEVADARVPLLIVQPLVENALRHGLAPRVESGHISVRAVRDNGWTRIDVDDTGVGLPDGWTLEVSPGTGLRNLASRLKAEYGDGYALDVRPADGGGVRATVRLPYTPS